ncbi:5-hydroxytryptamine receptor 2 [Biomphalaria glabrata]|nr:5-hydroxytryptamine receptor 2-like [Biomphalaria glabrata]
MPYIYDVVSDEQFANAMFVYTKMLAPICQIFAISFNILNMTIFFRMGLRDSFNITFFALSLSDLFCVLLEASDTVCLNIAMSPWQQNLPVSLYSISGGIHYYQYIFFDTSVCLETFLAVTRCCCVAMPLRFKNMFAYERSLVIILILIVCNFVFRIPLLSSYTLTWQTHPSTNQTIFTFYSTNDFKFYSSLEQIASHTIFPVILFCIATLCSVILTTSLADASLKRNLMTRAKSNPESVYANELKTDHVNLSTKTLNTKEVQLVKAVTLVTLVLGLVLLILSVFSLAEAAVPEFFARKKYNNTHSVCAIVVSLVILSHSGYKFIIYYSFNSKFRMIIKRILGLSI